MNTSILDISNYLNTLFPIEQAESWDKPGFSFFFIKEVKKVFICIDLTPKILDQAINENVDLIITHHPFLFYDTKTLNYKFSPYKRKMVKIIKQAQINVFSLHTNYDSSSNATANAILKHLGLNVIQTQSTDNYNLLVETKIKFFDLVKQVKNALNLKHLQTNLDKNININKIAILPGSGGIEAVFLAKKHKADLVITSDLKWSDQLSFSFKNINVLLVPHLVEQFFAFDVKQRLEKEFSNQFETKIVLLKEILYNI